MTLIIDTKEAQALVTARLKEEMQGITEVKGDKTAEVEKRLYGVVNSIEGLRGNIHWAQGKERRGLFFIAEPASAEIRGHWAQLYHEVESPDPEDPEFVLVEHIYGAQSLEYPHIAGWGPTPLHAVAEMNQSWVGRHG